MGQGIPTGPTVTPDPAKMQILMKDLAIMGPQAATEKWYQSDQDFRQFADSMNGVSPQQAFAARGLDFDQTISQAKQMFGW